MSKDRDLRNLNASARPWYHQGLRFMCTGCGACCTGSGRVWLTEAEMYTLAESLELDVNIFVDRHVERREGRWSLRENQSTGECVFLSDGRCQVYLARPRQCRTFPWWPTTLSQPEAWQEARRVCEGIDHPEAPLVQLEDIREALTEEQQGRSSWRR